MLPLAVRSGRRQQGGRLETSGEGLTSTTTGSLCRRHCVSVVGGGGEEECVLELRVCEAWRVTVSGGQVLYLSLAERREKRALHGAISAPGRKELFEYMARCMSDNLRWLPMSTSHPAHRRVTLGFAQRGLCHIRISRCQRDAMRAAEGSEKCCDCKWKPYMGTPRRCSCAEVVAMEVDRRLRD